MAKKNSKKTVPDLRFRGFTDPWEQRQLGEVAQRVTRRNLNNECSRVLTASAEAGLIDQQEYFQKRIASHDLSHYYLLKRGDFAYNHSSSGSAALGIIKRLEAYDFGCLSTLYIIFHPKHGIDSDYLLHYFESSAWHGDVAGMVTEGARNHGLLNISPDTFFTARCSFPSLPEQRRIGKFFTIFDSLIAAAERQETLLRRKKQAYLQLMFPREGETQPRLRFAGFSGGWERRQLREVAVKTGSGGTPTSSNPRYYGGSIPFLGIGDINGRYVDTTQKTLTEEGVANSAAWIVPQGAISLAMYASYGKSAILARPMATSQAFFNIVFRSNVTRDFVFSRLQCAESRHEWDALVSTGTQPNLSGSKLKKWTIGYPSLPEQHHIGEFFKVLDSLIAAAEERTKALTALKSVYLQRMFA